MVINRETEIMELRGIEGVTRRNIITELRNQQKIGNSVGTGSNRKQPVMKVYSICEDKRPNDSKESVRY